VGVEKIVHRLSTVYPQVYPQNVDNFTRDDRCTVSHNYNSSNIFLDMLDITLYLA